MTVAVVRKSDGAIVDVLNKQPDIPAPAGAEYVEGAFDRNTHLGQRYANGQPVVDVPVRLPMSCTPLQARRALRQSGLIGQVNATIKQADPDTQDAWEYATIIHRDSPIIAVMAQSLGLTNQQVDDLFALAVTL